MAILHVPVASRTRSLGGHASRPRPRPWHAVGPVGQRPRRCTSPPTPAARPSAARRRRADRRATSIRSLADTRFFLSVLEGLDDAALAAAVLPLPSHEVDPYRGLAPHLQVASAARDALLSALAAGEARVVVASAAALLPRLRSARAVGAAPRSISSPAWTSSRSSSPRSWWTPASPGRIRSTSTASSASAAASSTSFRPATRSRSASSSSATPSSRCGASIRPRSDRSDDRPVAHRARSVRRVGESETPADPRSASKAASSITSPHRRPVTYVVVESDETRAAAAKFSEQIAASYEALRHRRTPGPRGDAAGGGAAGPVVHRPGTRSSARLVKCACGLEQLAP